MLMLRKWDWDLQRYVDVPTPPAPVVKFVLWLRETKAWHEDVELVHRRFRLMEREIADELAAHREAQQATAANMTAPPTRSRREVALANLAKARAVKAAKRTAKGG